MSEINVFEQFNETEIEEDSLKSLENLCNQFRALESDISQREQELKNKKKELEEISRVKIPTVLNNNGLSEIRLSNGNKVIVKDKVKASVNKNNMMLAYRNMVNIEGGGEIGEKVADTFFKSSLVIEDYSEDVLELLLDKEIPYETKKTIHPATLSKYCREKLEKGEQAPEGVTVFQYQETTIKGD